MDTFSRLRIAALKNPVTIMYGVRDVSRAGYCARRSRAESRRSAANRALLDDIKRVHPDNHECHGSPRVHLELHNRPLPTLPPSLYNSS